MFCLAFAELGKVGYKIEFRDQTIKDDWETNENLLPIINYWLDKVFPNKRDENGKITDWLTPWSYEIRMDWSSYTDANERAADKSMKIFILLLGLWRKVRMLHLKL